MLQSTQLKKHFKKLQGFELSEVEKAKKNAENNKSRTQGWYVIWWPFSVLRILLFLCEHSPYCSLALVWCGDMQYTTD